MTNAVAEGLVKHGPPLGDSSRQGVASLSKHGLSLGARGPRAQCQQWHLERTVRAHPLFLGPPPLMQRDVRWLRPERAQPLVFERQHDNAARSGDMVIC